MIAVVLASLLLQQPDTAAVHARATHRAQMRAQNAARRDSVVMRGDHLPENVEGDVDWLVLDPSADYLRLAGDDAEGFVHPLSANSEVDYRFSSGDTSTIALPNGNTIRLLQLIVRPRRA